MSGTVTARGMGILGWVMLAVTLASAIPLGSNRPVSWVGLSMVTFALFSIGILIELWKPSIRSAKLWPSAILVMAAIGWGFVQTIPALSAAAQAIAGQIAALLSLPAPDLIHPVWSTVDMPGTISADPIDGHHTALRMTCYVAVFWLAVQAGRDTARGRMMLMAAAAGITLMCAFALFAATTGVNPVLGEDAGLGGTLTGTFINRNSFGTYAAFGVIINLVLLTDAMAGKAVPSQSKALRNFLEQLIARGWLFGLGFAICAVALLGSQSRGGALAGVFGAAFVFALTATSKGDRGRAIPAAILVVVLAIFVFTISAAGVLDRLMATTPGDDMRSVIYMATIEGIADKPLIGHGLGAYWDMFRVYVPEAAGRFDWDRAHNTYLELIFELGLPAALALFTGILLVVVRIVASAATERRGRVVPLAAAGCALAAGVHSLFDFSLQIPAITVMFAFILGLGFSQATKPEQKSRRSSRASMPERRRADV